MISTSLFTSSLWVRLRDLLNNMEPSSAASGITTYVHTSLSDQEYEHKMYICHAARDASVPSPVICPLEVLGMSSHNFTSDVLSLIPYPICLQPSVVRAQNLPRLGVLKRGPFYVTVSDGKTTKQTDKSRSSKGVAVWNAVLDNLSVY